MSSIGQSVLMALTVRMNQFVSSNVHAVHRREGTQTTTTNATSTTGDVGRRGLILSAVAAAPQLPNSTTQLLEKYLKKSEENKAKNDKERLESYYKRNYKDYFEFVEGSLMNKKEPLSDSEKGILDWLKSNK